MKERLKTVLIIVLVLTGLLQVGILWSYQSQGTPFSFLLALFNSDIQVSDETIREKLFVPEKLVISNGENDYWIIAENHDYYDRFLDEVFSGLSGIAEGNVELSVSGRKMGGHSHETRDHCRFRVHPGARSSRVVPRDREPGAGHTSFQQACGQKGHNT